MSRQGYVGCGERVQGGYMKIAFFAFETRDLNTFPSILSAIKLLSREGHSIDVYVPSPMATSVAIDRCRFLIISDFNQFEYLVNAVHAVRDSTVAYDAFFAFYIEGLFVCEILNRNLIDKVPVIYFSMELMYKDYPYRLLRTCMRPTNLMLALYGFISRLFKVKPGPGIWQNASESHLKALCYGFMALKSWTRLKNTGKDLVRLAIISDEMRARVLRDEFSFVDKIAFVPAAGYIGYNDLSSRYAHQRFQLPEGKRILLYTGGLERGFDLDLLEMSKKLDDEYVLFCNVYSRDDYIEEIISIYADEIGKGKIFFQLENLDEEEYDELVRSCYAGIAWYPAHLDAIPNMYYLGFSSGKLNKLLSCGRPVISRTSIYGYREMIEGNMLGAVCDEASEIPAAVTRIEAHYSEIRQRIKPFYLEHLEFEGCFKPIIEELGRWGHTERC